MTTSAGNPLTTTPEARFFLAPEGPRQRQYEALRAYFIEHLPSAEVARRFGYSPGAFRALCYQFRHDSAERADFFTPARPGPRDAPARDPVRDLAIAMRQRNPSVYDMQRELAEAGHAISISSRSCLLREEGFARLPRRRDEERPVHPKPEAAAIADVRAVKLTPRTFATRLRRLFSFVPRMRALRMAAVLSPAQL